ncbi:uncharacterized protein PAC_01379 [Phialocephala subalpina]|uniref:Uncharacterized protein n=1 Tax=Phialocephala subalpina TaxID=576137 RepID=A0A1L7WFE9_9HELO|nr:uncharacterized protein PAC_01379 [Phialocephala subalpina]
MASNALSVVQTTPDTPASATTQKASDDLWSEAVKLLRPDDENQIRLQEGDKLTVLSEVLAATIEKQERCKDRQWRFKKKDGTFIVLRDVFDKIVSWLKKLQSIGDFVAQLDPVHLALPWSIIKFFLQVSTGDTERLGAVYDGIEKIANLIGRYAIFEDLYLRETSKASDLLKKVIVKLYSSVLTYLAGAKRYYAQNTAMRVTKNILQISDVDIDKLAEDIQSEQIGVDELARLIDAESLRNANQIMKRLSTEAREHKEELKHALADLKIDDIHDQLLELTKYRENSKKLKLLKWISRIPYSKHHENVRKGRLEGSGIWLFDQPHSLLIDTLKGNAINQQAESLAYVYCVRNATELERGEPLAILRSILRQLSCPKPNMDVQDVVLKKYQELQEEGFEPRDLTLVESKALILELLEHNKATIIIDALDECIPERRYQLLSTIQELVENASCPVKIVVTSREYEDITSRLSKMSNFKIDAGNNKSDIERFVRLEVDRAVRESRLLGGRASVQLQEKVIQTLIDGAQGMFLWVALQIRNLCNPQRMKFEKDVLDELRKLPEKLAEIYSTIFAEIHSAGGRLSATDFIKAVSFEVADQELEVSASTLLDICGNLVVLDTELDVFRFTHLSVREFLERRPDFSPKLTHATAAEICLNTLLTRDWLSSEITWQKPTLYQYATLYWASHTELCGKEYRKHKIWDALTQIFARDDRVAPWFAKWLLQVESASQTLGWDDPLKDKIEQSLGHPETCLFTACTFGFSEVVELLSKASPSAFKRVNVTGATGLHLASQYGHLNIVRTLLDAGVEIDAKDDGMTTALVRACSAGHDGIVTLLLDRGADQNVQGERYGTALQAASLRGHRNVVELLLEGADLDAEGGQFGTALQAASLRGHQGVVKALLAKGAEANALGGEYTKTAEISTGKSNPDGVAKVIEFLVKQSLCNICDNPSLLTLHETIVQLLLDEGLDINVQSGGFGPALQAASCGGHEEVVRMLLDAGADPNAEGGAYGTALQAAAVSGNVEVVQLLLGARAYVNTQSGMYNTALQAACRRQDEKTIRILLDNKADINAQGGIYGSALQAASRTGSTRIVKLLLDRCADVNAQGGDYGTALQAASADGFQEIVRMLLETRAEVNLHGGKYGTALQAASGAGHREVVELLVKHGAKFDNALQIAAIGGHDEVVVYLLNKGADPNGQGGPFGTALQTASAAGREKVVQLLLDNNADANSKGSRFGTTLQVAAAAGNKRVVRVLLDKGADPTLEGGNIGTISAQMLEGEESDKDSEGRLGPETLSRAIEVASANGHLEVARLLLDNGAEINPRRGQTPLQSSCRNGHQDVVQLLLARNADVCLAKHKSFPPLHAATQGNHEVIVRQLLEEGADVAPDTDYGNVVHIASYGGFENLVRIFLDKGVSARTIGKSNITPLLLASIGGYDAIVRLLLENGADTNTVVGRDYSSEYLKESQHFTALRAAVYGGHENVVRLLLQHGATVNATQISSGTALQVACSKGNEDIVRILLDKGADPNIKGGTYGTALQTAAYHGFGNIVQLLLNKGVDINIMSGLYSTALQAAAVHGDEKVVQVLISRGADVRRESGEPEKKDRLYVRIPGQEGSPVAAKRDPNGRCQKGRYGTSLQAAALLEMWKLCTPLHRAAYHGHIAVVELLMTRGAHVDEVDVRGRTALRWVANYGYEKLLGLLSVKGAHMDIRDGMGQTAMHRAARNGHIAVVRKLMENGLEVDLKDHHGQSPLFCAVENGKLAMVRFLLANGASVEHMDSRGNIVNTALHIASSTNRHTIIRLLLENGANIEPPYVLLTHGAYIKAKDSGGQTALHLAAAQESTVVLTLLIVKGASVHSVDGLGRTVLHVAASKGETESMAILLDRGANIESRDLRGRTPLHIASSRHQYTAIELLVDRGADMYTKSLHGELAISDSRTRQRLERRKRGEPFKAFI